MRYYVLASGSKGNATVIEANGHVIQIDMGISLRSLCRRLTGTPFCKDDIKALLLTHEHTDHVGHAYRFEPESIFTSSGTYNRIPEQNILYPYQNYVINNFAITVLPTSHDATNPIGFIIEANGEKLIYMTDTGYISEKNLKLMENPDYIIIESNHNVRMLFETDRPMNLIKRILGDVGHLSNEDSAFFIADIIGPNTKEITLAHLSEEANSPSVALAAYKEILAQKHVDFTNINIQAASQHYVVSGGKKVNI